VDRKITVGWVSGSPRAALMAKLTRAVERDFCQWIVWVLPPDAFNERPR